MALVASLAIIERPDSLRAKQRAATQQVRNSGRLNTGVIFCSQNGAAFVAPLRASVGRRFRFRRLLPVYHYIDKEK